MSTIRSSVPAGSYTPSGNYTPADFIRAELGYFYPYGVHLEFAEILLSYQDNKDIAVCTPLGFLYSYRGELGFSLCLEQEGSPTPLYFTDVAGDAGSSAKYRANHRSYTNFEPTIILRRYYHGNTNK